MVSNEKGGTLGRYDSGSVKVNGTEENNLAQGSRSKIRDADSNDISLGRKCYLQTNVGVA